jgi:nitrogen-specific signal transduction histidine kinase
MNESKNGEFVYWSDYARLKAEVERLKIYDYKNLSMRIEIDKLNAKINRLVKAGDKMVLCIDGDYNYQMPCVQAWNAAKDGKLSE